MCTATFFGKDILVRAVRVFGSSMPMSFGYKELSTSTWKRKVKIKDEEREDLHYNTLWKNFGHIICWTSPLWRLKVSKPPRFSRLGKSGCPESSPQTVDTPAMHFRRWCWTTFQAVCSNFGADKEAHSRTHSSASICIKIKNWHILIATDRCLYWENWQASQPVGAGTATENTIPLDHILLASKSRLRFAAHWSHDSGITMS